MKLEQAVLQGIDDLQARHCEHLIPTYCRLVEQAADTGETLAGLLATHLVPVLQNMQNDAALLDCFLEAVAVMQTKGTYTLKAPLEMLSELLKMEDVSSAHSYLELLTVAFQQDMSYNLSLRLVYLLPKAVGGFNPGRRPAQIRQLQRAIETHPDLADAFMEGMQKGLALLSAEALAAFMNAALKKYRASSESGGKFLALASTIGRDTCAALQVAVPLTQVRARLNRYVTARLGRAVPIESLSAAPADTAGGPWVCSDGHLIFLPDEIDYFDSPLQNQALYATLVRLEACFFECGSFDFDLERAADRYPAVSHRLADSVDGTGRSASCDAQRWFDLFSVPALAEDLFNLFEQARIIHIISGCYPGLIRQVRPVLQAEALRLWEADKWRHPLIEAYSRLVLDIDKEIPVSSESRLPGGDLCRLFSEKCETQAIAEAAVETAADLTCAGFPAVAKAVKSTYGHPYPALRTPFGWRLNWDLIAKKQDHDLSDAIKTHLAEHGVKIYRSDLQKFVTAHDGSISLEALQAFILAQAHGTAGASISIDWSRLDLETVLEGAGGRAFAAELPDVSGFRYPEWDCQSRDYLHAHTCVQETPLPQNGDHDFYRMTLGRYPGLLSRTRRAFELLKPQGLTLLRQWPEGDAFDYRALLDFAVDRRIGRIPSDRLFIKRLKKERNVAVLLLVDMSRSTANPVSTRQNTVLDIAKEALVLFCEALQVVGDTYGIAGFSGTGRHAVDYYRIKDFHEALNPGVQDRISGMTPQRSTRMGAAIRHAAAQLDNLPAAVRLLMIISDGFPNDLGYKADYAIADTRRAIQEARSRNHHVKAITVNIGSDPRLDDLYGRHHYHVIEDVTGLPDKLIKMYSTLTKA